jgi:formate--tetrahydrofolate ligase
VHIENMKKYGVPVVVAINRFQSDTGAELAFVKEFCEGLGAEVALAEVFANGGKGGLELAEKVCKTIETKPSQFHVLYDTNLSVEEKVGRIATEIYRADGVTFTAAAKKALAQIEALGCGNLPVCVAKTQYSLSDDPTKLGKPEHFTLTVRDVTLSNGAGFIVVLTGNIMTMPGLPKSPAALRIDCDNEGNITGLF